MTQMPLLETACLLVRPFVMEDLPDTRCLLDVELCKADLRKPDLRTDKMENLTERAQWLQWTGLNHE